MNDRTTIKSLHIKNFGCFSDKKIEFGPELNQVVGPNESGKSTIIKALYTVLFEDGSTQKKNVANWNNWTSEQSFKLALEFSVGGKDFNLIRDYGAGRDIMTDSDGITYEGKAIGEKLALYFGTVDRNLFESIFCFSSDHPEAPETNKLRLKTAIELPVFYGFDRGRADRYLDEEIKKLDNPRAHGPRELDLIAEQISGHLQEKGELEKRMEALDKDRRELDDVRAKLQEHESSIDRLDKELEGGTAYAALNSKMINLEERLQVHLGNYSRAVQVTEDLQRVDKELNRIYVPEEDEMTSIVLEREEMTLHVDERKQIMDETILHRQKAKRGAVVATIFLILVTIAYFVKQNGHIPSNAFTDLIPYTIPLMGLIWLFRAGVYFVRFRRKKTATILFREAVTKLDNLYQYLNDKYHIQAADPVKALEDNIQRRKSLILGVENLTETIHALSEGKGLEYLNQVRQQIEQEVAQLNQELTPLISFAAVSTKLPDLKEELISRRVRSNALRERAALLAERCTVIKDVQEEMSRVDEQVEVLKRRHKDITERLEILKITRNALNRAADNLIEDTFEAYGATASNFLTGLTGTRYDQLRFVREGGRFEVKVNATDRWHEITETLSSSTRDSIYIALRLAGVVLLSSEFCPPVIFDQADTRMDRERRKALSDLIAQIARSRQIILVGIEKNELLGESHLIEFSAAEAISQPATAS